MRKQPSSSGLLFALLLLAAAGCEEGSSGSGGGTTSPGTGGAGATGGGGAGGAGGEGGETVEPLPPLDPEACPVTPGGGEDSALVEAAEAQWSATFSSPESGSVQQDKAFPLATSLAGDEALLAELAVHPVLSAVSEARDAALRAAPEQCESDTDCYAGLLGWAEADAEGAAAELTGHLETTGKLAAFAGDLRASGKFALHATLADAELVDVAFRDLVVALGKTFSDEAGALGGAALHDVVESVVAAHPEPLPFFEPLLLVGLAALAADGRDEGSRYEPLTEGENAAAVAHIPSIEWSKYPFTVIVIPGLGPTSLDVALSPGGQMRADLAAQRFAAGIAPLIALSGGHVHPDRTPYSEAIEMKKYLLATHDLPEEVILVDPHARHTTTNLRNVSRLLYRYGVPTGQPALVTSDLGQSIYIGYWGGMFGPRCEEELGYLPWSALVPISPNDACFRPVAISLHADGRDPLDP